MPLDANNITLRSVKGSDLTYEELDENFFQIKLVIEDYQASFDQFSGWKDDAETSYLNTVQVYNDTLALISGYGDIVTQNADDVDFTGGSITGVTFSGTIENSGITGGTITSLDEPILVADGGTGSTTLEAYGLLYGNGTDPIGAIAPSAAGWTLKSGGPSAAPYWEEESYVGKGSDSTSGSVVLTSTSDSIQRITTTNWNQSVKLPDATELPIVSVIYTIVNDGSYTLVVKDAASNILGFILSGESCIFGLSDNSTAAGEWTHSTSLQKIGLTNAIEVSASFNNTSFGHLETVELDADRLIIFGYRPDINNSALKVIVYNKTTNVIGAEYTITPNELSYGNIRAFKSSGDGRITYCYLLNAAILRYGYLTISGNTISSHTENSISAPASHEALNGSMSEDLIELGNSYFLAYVLQNNVSAVPQRYFFAMPKTYDAANASAQTRLYTGSCIARASVDYVYVPYSTQVDTNKVLSVSNNPGSSTFVEELTVNTATPLTITSSVLDTSPAFNSHTFVIQKISNTKFIFLSRDSGSQNRIIYFTRDGSAFTYNGQSDTTLNAYAINPRLMAMSINTAGDKGVVSLSQNNNGSGTLAFIFFSLSGTTITLGTIRSYSQFNGGGSVIRMFLGNLGDNAYFLTSTDRLNSTYSMSLLADGAPTKVSTTVTDTSNRMQYGFYLTGFPIDEMDFVFNGFYFTLPKQTNRFELLGFKNKEFKILDMKIHPVYSSATRGNIKKLNNTNFLGQEEGGSFSNNIYRITVADK